MQSSNKLLISAAAAVVATVTAVMYHQRSTSGSTSISDKKKANRKFKLVYFDIPGKAEAIRLLATFYGIDLIDHRMKDADEFKTLKHTLAFGQVPALFVSVDGMDEVQLVQTAAIMRYLGKIIDNDNAYPSCLEKAAIVDAIIDAETDLFVGISVCRYKERFGFGFLAEKQECLSEAYEKLSNEVIPRHIVNIQKYISSSTTQFIGSTAQPSIADFVLVPRLIWLFSGIEGIAIDLNDYPIVKQYIHNFLKQSKIVEYYQTHQRLDGF